VNPAGKLTSIIAGMVAGADSIDDLDVIRSGGMPRLFGGVYACSTRLKRPRSILLGNYPDPVTRGVGPGGPANLKSRPSRTSMDVHPSRWLSNSSAGRLWWNSSTTVSDPSAVSTTSTVVEPGGSESLPATPQVKTTRRGEWSSPRRTHRAPALAEDPRHRRRDHPALQRPRPAGRASKSTAGLPSPTPNRPTTRPSVDSPV